MTPKLAHLPKFNKANIKSILEKVVTNMLFLYTLIVVLKTFIKL